MAEDIIASEPEGQVDAAPEGTTAETSEGQSLEGQDAGTTSGPQTPAEDSFFDPNEVPDNLKPAYKNMQAAFTKRMQELSKHRQKIEAYDAFYSNPVENIRNVARQYGIDLGGNQEQKGPDVTAEDYQPKSWQEVYSNAKEMAKSEILQELQPFIQGVQQVRKESIEHQLNEIDPTWQQYEDAMKDNMSRHPSLARDPALLYRVSVPPEVLESRATQRALKRLEAKGQSAQVSSSSTTTKHPSAMPDKPVSFADAVAAAKRKLADDGIAPGK
jgi:hypothetical protein